MSENKVRIHLPDFTTHAKLNLVLLSMFKNVPEYFRDNLEIASVYGSFPPSMWNGGRTIGGVVCAPDYVQGVVNAFNSQGIPLRFTFTNPAIKEEHLNDEFCNMVMDIANNGMNEVIVHSPVLEEYIRTKYPKYKITSSTCKRITDPEKLKEELEKDYNVVVVDYDLNNKFDILEQLPHKEKCEFLINSCCIPNCPRRADEYYNVGLQQIAYVEHLKKNPNKPFNMADYSDVTMSSNFRCDARNRTPFEVRKLPHHISPDAIWNKYVPMGFNQFKLSGRGSSRLYIIEEYMYYLIKPEFVDEARFMFMHNLEVNKIISVDNFKG